MAEALKRPVTTGTALLAIGLMLARWGDMPLDALTTNGKVFWDEPWRLVTSVLVHADIVHLGFNVYWLWIFGTQLERVFGGLRLLALMLLLAIGSSAAEYAISVGGVGLSGVGYGLFGFVYVLEKRDPRFAGAVDARTAKLFGIWFVFCIVATKLKWMSIANVAHGTGALLGFAAGLAVAPSRRVLQRVGGAITVAVLLAGFIAAGSVFRRHVNQTDEPFWTEFGEGNAALDKHNPDEAIAHYRRALEIDPTKHQAWFNIGVAEEEAERHEKALSAYERAVELEPGDTDYADALAFELAKKAFSLPAEQVALKIELYERATTLRPGMAWAWGNLALQYEKSGRTQDAEKARAKGADPEDP
jgi:membrane associated rhomboid family serine protease